jgi:hypothetical protein
MGKVSFGKYLFILARDVLVEPILFTSGLALLFSRIQSICWDVYASTGEQNIGDILRAINADWEADPMIYYILLGIFLIWLFYRGWRLKQERDRDALIQAQTDLLRELAQNIKQIRKSLEEMQDNKKHDD